MPRFLGCRVEVAFDDDTPAFSDDDVDVEIEEGQILITYFDDQGAVVFQGKEETPGCFELTARSRPRKARLTRSDSVLEGSWWEVEARGTLRIELQEEEP